MTDKRRYAIEYRRVSDSEVYKFTSEDWGDGESPRGASIFHHALVSRSVDNGNTWTLLPLRLDLHTVIRRWIAKSAHYWPPTFIDDLVPGENEKISFTFHDPEPWEGSSPSDWDAPSVWRAIYLPPRRRWRLERVRRLDYDGIDAPLRYQDVRWLRTPPPDQGPPPAR
jgi:hypothetical protein